ncbi:MAG: hypothetical protein ABIW76_20670 [Fibrobacteria bacterium]
MRSNRKSDGFGSLVIALSAILLAASFAGAQSQHPGFKVETLNLTGAGINLKEDMGVNGLGFLKDGRMAVATWGGDKRESPKQGKVYLLSGVLGGGPITAKQIASGMNDNGGLVVVNDTLYVTNKDGIFWIDPKAASTTPTLLAKIPWSGNYHEYHSTPMYKDGFLYSIVHQPYYTVEPPFIPLPERGAFLKVNRITGEKENIAGGLREPNGGNIGPEGDFFVGDNQGHWVPSAKLVHVTKGDFFGFDNSLGPFYKPTMQQKLPAIWFEYRGDGSSPTQPILLTKGIFKNQMLIGDHYACNLMRLFLEKVGGEWQGASFVVLDSKAFTSTPNRMVYAPDSSAIYIGGIGSVTNWSAACGGERTMMKMTLTGESTFEILAMRSVANGFELEFTSKPGPSALDKASYSLQRWAHHPEFGYNDGAMVKKRSATIVSVTPGSVDTRVTLVLNENDLKHEQGAGILQSTVFRLDAKGVRSADGKALHTALARYTLNKIGPGRDPEGNAVALKTSQGKNLLNPYVNARTLYLQGAGKVIAKIWTLDGRVLQEVNATGPAVMALTLPAGVHLLTGTLDGAPFSQKVVAAP